MPGRNHTKRIKSDRNFRTVKELEKQLQSVNAKTRAAFFNVATLDLKEFVKKIKREKSAEDSMTGEEMKQHIEECEDLYIQRFLAKKSRKIEERTHLPKSGHCEESASRVSP